jgi:hypothetical protein
MLPITRRRPSLAVVLASAALGVALAGTVTSTDAAPSKKKPNGTIILSVADTVTVEPGNVVEGKAKCPRGYSVIAGSYSIGGESAYAHAVDSSIQSRTNSYAAIVVNPPALPTLPGSGRTATLLVGANCAKTGYPIVPITPYKQR